MIEEFENEREDVIKPKTKQSKQDVELYAAITGTGAGIKSNLG